MSLKDIRREARESLRGNWGTAIGAWLVAALIPLGIVWFVTPIFGGIFGSIFEMILDALVNWLIGGILTAGLSWLFLGFVDRKTETFGNLFLGFKYFGKIIGTTLLISLFLFLWALAIMLPAIIIVSIVLVALGAPELATVVGFVAGFLSVFVIGIIGYRYAMAMFIIKDSPAISPRDAVHESKELMRGHKWRYFLLQLQFLLWYLPGIITVVVAIVVFLYGIGSAALANPLFAAQLAAGNFAAFESIAGSLVVAILLLLIGGLYWFGISFYVAPYRHAANAVFYRRLANAPTMGAQSEAETFVFANNTPPKETVVEDVLVKEEVPTFEVPE